MELAEATAKTGRERRHEFALLAVEGVTMRFGGVTALQDVSFTVAQGAICGLIGPNGAGKTTLFNCISRLYDPHAGSIRFDHRPLASVSRHEMAALGVARTFQNVALFSTMTTRDNVRVAPTRWRAAAFSPMRWRFPSQAARSGVWRNARTR